MTSDNAMTIVTRQEWIAMPPKETEEMTLPVENVHFTIENHIEHCDTKKECTEGVKFIQCYYSDKGLEDIPYNFLVGNDGNVYEGRGWKYKPGPNIQLDPRFRDKTIDIGIICGHDESTVEAMDLVLDALKTARKFVNYSIEQKMIVENYNHFGFTDDLVPREI